ncbi:hypothetical protein IMG5_189850 [Ichthyophthirius multifiliis]|uniref:Uncharacterized protein n=1 Tax=Ichthyophthirius multifiliis TaxID=5932 RepID=G0R455_ICHMU|nr:hypothetical protein IMG5_189850 [Ichthyophthirius multifiliis]EGR27755.1 hypothetical protein IMG5_189850 [Ichthyophthirius multifiliis]|eukprot:XP_004025207.1 hypothetical protein IMG5_189850 [Ichthyophthirius multifiliis]
MRTKHTETNNYQAKLDFYVVNSDSAFQDLVVLPITQTSKFLRDDLLESLLAKVLTFLLTASIVNQIQTIALREGSTNSIARIITPGFFQLITVVILVRLSTLLSLLQRTLLRVSFLLKVLSINQTLVYNLSQILKTVSALIVLQLSSEQIYDQVSKSTITQH